MKAAFSPQAAKQRLFCRLEVVYGADAFDDFGGEADLGDDFLQGLVGHGGFVDGVLHDAGGVNAGHLGAVFLHGEGGGGLLPAHEPAGSVGGQDPPGRSERAPGWYFNPPAPWGRDPAPPCSTASATYFNPPAPWGGGTCAVYPQPCGQCNFNPPAPWGGGTSRASAHSANATISIHPPRLGGTMVLAAKERLDIFQSTRPRGGAGPASAGSAACGLKFQSTRPVGAGRMGLEARTRSFIFQSTRPVGGGTYLPSDIGSFIVISIHPPRGGGTVILSDLLRGPIRISIHPPRGGRDMVRRADGRGSHISIHPPRGRRDSGRSGRQRRRRYFNPPAPWGAGPVYKRQHKQHGKFQSTRPVGGDSGPSR